MKVWFVLNKPDNLLYHESTAKALTEKGHSVSLVCPLSDDEKPLLEQELLEKGLNLAVEPMPVWPRGRKYRAVLTLRQLRSVANYLSRDEKYSPYYRQRWESYLPENVQKFTSSAWGKFLLKQRPAEATLAWAEARIPCPAAVLEHLKAGKPDIVLVAPSNLKSSREPEYLKAARVLGIPTAISVHSWDNLTTKGVLPVVPDLLLAWNNDHLEQAVALHQVPRPSVKVIGSPFFDQWRLRSSSPTPRETFLQKVGLDPNRPYLMYLGSSASVSKDEIPLVKNILAGLRKSSSEHLRQMQILVRPHPSNAGAFSRLDMESVRVWPELGTLPTSLDHFQGLVDSLMHSEAALGLNTSAMIDALIARKPCLCLLLPEHTATQNKALHFRELLESGSLYVTRGVEELIQELGSILVDKKDPLQEKRDQFLLRFLWPQGLDKLAGEVGAEALTQLYGQLHSH